MKNKQKIIGATIVFIIFLVFLSVGYYLNSNKRNNYDDIFVQQQDNINDNNKGTTVSKAVNSTNSNEYIKVEIKGEVKKPDVYSLKNGSIVLDLVNASGGYTEQADVDSVVQCTKLKDGDCIRVSKKGAVNSSVSSQNTSNITNTSLGGKININTATKEELMSINGIGSTKADKIIQYREQNGPYKSLEDLKKIGARIGDTTINNMKDKADVR